MTKENLFEIEDGSEEEKKLLVDKLLNFNKVALNLNVYKPYKPLTYNIKINNEIIAGINAKLYINQMMLYVELLFVEEKYRKMDLGSKLLAKVEKEAMDHNVKLAHLETFDFQSKDFYQKKGYEIFGILENCPFSPHKLYYLKKNL